MQRCESVFKHQDRIWASRWPEVNGVGEEGVNKGSKQACINVCNSLTSTAWISRRSRPAASVRTFLATSNERAAQTVLRKAELNSSIDKKAAINRKTPVAHSLLSRELSDEVYGYLLRPSKGSRKKISETNLLAVNATDHEEIEECLHHSSELMHLSQR